MLFINLYREKNVSTWEIKAKGTDEYKTKQFY